MKTIIIRCDASINIGSGHVMRCRTIARELRSQDRKILFLCREQPGNLIDVLRDEFEVIKLPSIQEKSKEVTIYNEHYSNWLGCSQEQDAKDCVKLLIEADITP